MEKLVETGRLHSGGLLFLFALDVRVWIWRNGLQTCQGYFLSFKWLSKIRVRNLLSKSSSCHSSLGTVLVSAWKFVFLRGSVTYFMQCQSCMAYSHPHLAIKVPWTLTLPIWLDPLSPPSHGTMWLRPCTKLTWVHQHEYSPWVVLNQRFIHSMWILLFPLFP